MDECNLRPEDVRGLVAAALKCGMSPDELLSIACERALAEAARLRECLARGDDVVDVLTASISDLEAKLDDIEKSFTPEDLAPTSRMGILFAKLREDLDKRRALRDRILAQRARNE